MNAMFRPTATSPAHPDPDPAPGERPPDDLDLLINTLPPTWQDTLERLSPLPHWTDHTAQAAGVPLPFTWRNLARTALPVTAHPSGLTPHADLRAALQGRARARTDWKEIALAGARACERDGLPYEAVTLYLSANAVPDAIRIAQSLTNSWETHADWQRARDTLDQISEPNLDLPERALLALALVETGDGERGTAIAADVLSTRPHVAAYYALARQAYRTGDLGTFRDMTELGAEHTTRQRDLVFADRFRALYWHLKHDPDRAMHAARNAITRAENVNDRALHLSALTTLAFVQEHHATDEQSIRTYETVLDACLSLGYTHRAVPVIQVLWTKYRAGRHTRAARALLARTAGLYADHAPGQLNTWAMQAEQSLTEGDLTGALEHYRHLHRLARRERYLMASWKYVVEYAALVLFHANQPAELHDVLGVLDTATIESDNGQRNARTAALLLQAHAGAWTDVDRGVQDALAWTQGRHLGPNVMLTFLQARAAQQLGHLTSAHAEQLLAALRHTPAERAHLNLLPVWRNALLQAFITADWHASAWQDLQRDLAEDATPDRPDVVIRTLGHRSVTWDGQPLVLTDREAELLAYVAVHGAVHPGAAARALWPDRDPARALASARVTRSHVNNAAPGPLIVSTGTRSGLTWTLSPDVQVDVDATAALNAQDPHDARTRDQGTFLPGTDAEWAAQVRAQLAEHLAALYREAARTAPDPPRWWQAAAIHSQDPDDFEALAASALTQGRADLALAAQRALTQLQHGELAVLPPMPT